MVDKIKFVFLKTSNCNTILPPSYILSNSEFINDVIINIISRRPKGHEFIRTIRTNRTNRSIRECRQVGWNCQIRAISTCSCQRDILTACIPRSLKNMLHVL